MTTSGGVGIEQFPTFSELAGVALVKNMLMRQVAVVAVQGAAKWVAVCVRSAPNAISTATACSCKREKGPGLGRRGKWGQEREEL